ncbi:ParD-like family protein [Solimicrobium silvestre]|nr:ParD-like family protein [Solimicrobium silvestre]
MKISESLIEIAKPYAEAQHRSVPKQIEHWARLGKAAEENPELSIVFIQNSILALAEEKAGMATPYSFGE